MNILFSNDYEVSPHQGGTERITYTISLAFKQYYNYRCFLSYHIASRHKISDNIFDEKIQITSSTKTEELSNFINKNKIDYILIQGDFEDVIKYKKALKSTNHCKIIFTHHFEPAAEKNFFLFNDVLRDILKHRSLKNYLRIPLYPLLKVKYLIKLPKLYRKAYENSDASVLLLKDFVIQYMKFAKLSNTNKFTCIPNMLSYNDFCSLDEIENKEKTILIVSRFDERFKRLLLALEIWRKLKKQSCAKEWKLKIIGDGNDYHLYTKYIERKNIKDVYFLGRQEPIEYYKKASIFLMTSVSESWGLTITEAQQFGVVPIAFDCFPSLKEIISNQYDGFLIPENQLDLYTRTLTELIVNNSKRKEIAKNCITSSKRFSKEIIIKEWNNLLLRLKK